MSLEICVDSKYKEMMHSDRPDWQSEKLSIGLEVVRGINKYEGNCDAFLQFNFGKGLSVNELKDKTMLIENFSGEILEHEGKIIFLNYKSLVDTKVYKDMVLSEINKKIIKINNGYKLFDSNELYIFCPFPFEKNDIENIVLTIDDTANNPYSIFYFNCLDNIFCYNKSLDEIETIDVSNELLKKIKLLSFEK